VAAARARDSDLHAVGPEHHRADRLGPGPVGLMGRTGPGGEADGAGYLGTWRAGRGRRAGRVGWGAGRLGLSACQSRMPASVADLSMIFHCTHPPRPGGDHAAKRLLMPSSNAKLLDRRSHGAIKRIMPASLADSSRDRVRAPNLRRRAWPARPLPTRSRSSSSVPSRRRMRCATEPEGAGIAKLTLDVSLGATDRWALYQLYFFSRI
jgi:hypothetical protein